MREEALNGACPTVSNAVFSPLWLISSEAWHWNCLHMSAYQVSGRTLFGFAMSS